MRYQGCTVWEHIQSQLDIGGRAILMYVLESNGSSPGRRGFVMAVLSDGRIIGTIGGGIMEYKLVELARTMLESEAQKVILKQQYHSKDEPVNQSGMICSGSQQVVLVCLEKQYQAVVAQIIEACKGHHQGTIELGPQGIGFVSGHDERTRFLLKDQADWSYSEPLGIMPRVHIIGAGHVGLALSEMLSMLGFYILLYDDRNQLNTLEQNKFAHHKIITDYVTIGEHIPGDDQDYVVIMTFGYRTDKTVLLQLMDKPFYYLGMMGSDQKIQQLYEELDAEGIRKDRYAHLHAPIGVPILSKTAREIAVSVTAEIIREKNKHLPTGRT